MSIVTKTGDQGTTGLMYNRRVSKCHPRVESYGAVDELNAAIGLARATAEMTARLEKLIREIEAQKITYKGWATPGASLHSAALDLARTTCRRAERRACALQEASELRNPEILIYLNRLSDLLWLFARRAEKRP